MTKSNETTKNTSLKVAALKICRSMSSRKVQVSGNAIIRAMAEKLNISIHNASYYYRRVFLKGLGGVEATPVAASKSPAKKAFRRSRAKKVVEVVEPPHYSETDLA